MKITMFASLILSIVASMTEQARAQATLCLSTLSDHSSSYGPFSIGSDSWWAEGFFTGANVEGYILNSIQLRMAEATGNPSNLSVSLYGFDSAGRPGNSLAAFTGLLNPITVGTFTYTAAGSDLFLLPNTLYYVVLAAETPIAAGAFQWSTISDNLQQPSDWGVYYINYKSSNNGLSWGPNRLKDGQMAIYASAVPEPAANALFVLGLAGLGLWRRQRQ